MKKENTKPLRGVDEYLHLQPKEVQTMLTELRKTILESAPEAEELISYRIPTYKYKGPLIHFLANKDYCSLIVVTLSAMEKFKDELQPFHTSGRTIHFTPENPLPSELVKRIVKYRLAENENKP